MNKAELEQKIANKFPKQIEYIRQYPIYVDRMDYLGRLESRGEAKEYNYRYSEEDIMSAISIRLNPANIKVGDGVSVKLYTDRHAGTVIKVTRCKVVVQRDKATLDPNFKPEWIAGGFAGHCTNQHKQTYTYERDPNGEIYEFRWSNKYGQYGTPGNLTLHKGRREFYDYNF
ncbi:MAG: hypothetical protein MJY95_08250 [Bacteroidaceae bacterium]|nr:hypothetical protein [Bacteroidaceae bacterium]